MDKHICGQCGHGFATEELYLEHTCSTTGFKPTEPENLGEGFAAIQEAALERGAERAGETEHPAEAAAK